MLWKLELELEEDFKIYSNPLFLEKKNSKLFEIRSNFINTNDYSEFYTFLKEQRKLYFKYK